MGSMEQDSTYEVNPVMVWTTEITNENFDLLKEIIEDEPIWDDVNQRFVYTKGNNQFILKYDQQRNS
jgi:hypothetical protein